MHMNPSSSSLDRPSPTMPDVHVGRLERCWRSRSVRTITSVLSALNPSEELALDLLATTRSAGATDGSGVTSVNRVCLPGRGLRREEALAVQLW